jgi:L-gulono-1,4-lactone dehydrogenase
MASVKSGTWRNWAGNVPARPVREVAPASVEELATAVRKAAEDGLKVKAVGAGTRLKQLNVALARDGLSLTNMGDIMEQTVSGATSTGSTHRP